MDYISRSLEKAVMQVTNEYPVVLVTGPRQVVDLNIRLNIIETASYTPADNEFHFPTYNLLCE